MDFMLSMQMSGMTHFGVDQFQSRTQLKYEQKMDIDMGLVNESDFAVEDPTHGIVQADIEDHDNDALGDPTQDVADANVHQVQAEATANIQENRDGMRSRSDRGADLPNAWAVRARSAMQPIRSDGQTLMQNSVMQLQRGGRPSSDSETESESDSGSDPDSQSESDSHSDPDSQSESGSDRIEQHHCRTAQILEDALASRGRIVQAPALNVEQILSLEGARRQQVLGRVVSWLRIVEWLHSVIEHAPDEFHSKFRPIVVHMRNDDRVLLHTFIARPSLPIENLNLGALGRNDAQVELLSYYAKMEQIHINYLVAGIDYDESEEMDNAFLALTPDDGQNSRHIREFALPQQWAREERDPATPDRPTWEEFVAPMFASGEIPQLAGYKVRD